MISFGKTSAESAVEECIEQINKWNKHVNAVITFDPAAARAAANLADRAVAEGKPVGLLHGVPIMVKDNIETAGVKTTYGSGFFRDHVPSSDATVVKRLREAGAIILGKVTLHEFAFGVRSNNSVIGQCRNPWSLDRIPGGSSGGSGVAVATGMAPLALGTDTGGSVRIPAALNGITGLRPTVGRVSNHGCMPVSPTFDTIGPMGVNVTDVARLFTVMSGFDPLDPVSENRRLKNILVDMHEPIKGLRIGIPENHYLEGVSEDVAKAVESAIKVLESLGAKTYSIKLPGAETAHADATAMIYSDACSFHHERLKALSDNWLAATYERFQIGLKYTGRDYAQAMRARETWCRTLEGVFQEVDVILSPASPTTAPLIEDDRSLFEATRAVTQNTYAGAFGRLPGMSLPCGFAKDGLPIGLLLEAAPWEEAVLFKVGAAFQKATDWHTKKPTLPNS